MLNCPPYASVYLGAEGGLGGDAADRVAGFWRAIGAQPPAEPDHLTCLLSLYATMGEARLDHARQALFWEHLWSWVPGYLAAVTDGGDPALTAWADLTLTALAAEQHAHPDPPAPLSGTGPPSARPATPPAPPLDALPVALREAPPALTGGEDLRELLAALVAPVRSGMIITRRALAAGAGQAGAGHRIGERRFTLRAMLEQEPERTFAWLAGEADRWAGVHAAGAADDPVRHWWAVRARTTAAVLRSVS